MGQMLTFLCWMLLLYVEPVRLREGWMKNVEEIRGDGRVTSSLFSFDWRLWGRGGAAEVRLDVSLS